MSFILDALKKSETERQRTNTPGIAHIAEGGKRRHAGKWLWVVAALLAVNAVVLAALMMRSDDVTEAPAVQVQVPVMTPAASPPDTTTGFAEIVAAAKRSQPPPQDTRITGSADTTAAALPPDVPEASPAAPQSLSVTDGLPNFNELRAEGVLQLPDMHLDIHVYSAAPKDRFVFVNMRKYKERAVLDEGPLVKEITSDGVVLEHNGHAFLLPRE